MRRYENVQRIEVSPSSWLSPEYSPTAKTDKTAIVATVAVIVRCAQTGGRQRDRVALSPNRMALQTITLASTGYSIAQTCGKLLALSLIGERGISRRQFVVKSPFIYFAGADGLLDNAAGPG